MMLTAWLCLAGTSCSSQCLFDLSSPPLSFSLFSSPAWHYKWLMLALMSLYYTWLTMGLPGAGGHSLLRSCLMSQITACPKITFAFKWRADHAGNPTLLLVLVLPFSQILYVSPSWVYASERSLKSRGPQAELQMSFTNNCPDSRSSIFLEQKLTSGIRFH